MKHSVLPESRAGVYDDVPLIRAQQRAQRLPLVEIRRIVQRAYLPRGEERREVPEGGGFVREEFRVARPGRVGPRRLNERRLTEHALGVEDRAALIEDPLVGDVVDGLDVLAQTLVQSLESTR